MRRSLLAIASLLVAGLLLPPLWFSVFPQAVPSLPPAGRHIALADGQGINVLDVGNGPTLVLIHGLPGCAYDWAGLPQALAARGRHALAYDRVGYGRSDPRRDDSYTVEANAGELLALLDILDLRHVTLVGWSYGGEVALRAAHRNSQRISALALIGSPGPAFVWKQPLVERLLFSEPVLDWARRVPPLARAFARDQSRVAFSGSRYPDWWVPQLLANMLQPATTRAWLRESALLSIEGLDPAGLDMPVLVIQGSNDRMVPLAVAQDLQRRSKGELLVVAGGSHMLPITHTALLADRLARFSDLQAPASQADAVPRR